MIKWRNQDPSENTWVSENKLDSATAAYAQKHSKNMRGLDLSVIDNTKEIVTIFSFSTRNGVTSYNVLYADGRQGNVPGDTIPNDVLQRLIMEGFNRPTDKRYVMISNSLDK